MHIKHVILLSVFCLLLIVCALVHADIASYAQRSQCQNVDPCVGIRASNGRPTGCNRDWFEPGPDPCEGTCHQCQSNTAKTVCVYTNNCDHTCLGTTGGKTICGASYFAPCEGLWEDNCECCDDWEYEAASCELYFCNPDQS